MGYPKGTEGYYFYNPTENKMVVSRTVMFLERELVSKRNSGRKIDLDEDREPQDNVEPEVEHEQDIYINDDGNIAQETHVDHRSSRIRHEFERYV